MQLTSDRRYHFAIGPDALWSAIAATDEYRRWWPWLTEFEASGLVSGDVWRCRVRPPLPYTLRFAIHLDEVVTPTSIAARLVGDIVGRAALEVAADGEGSVVRLRSTLAPSTRAFGMIAWLARPIVERGHDWVLDTGARQFAQRANERTAAGRDGTIGGE